MLDFPHLHGQTPDFIVGWLPDWCILLGGDVMETPLPVLEEDSNVENWLESLKQWANNKSLIRTIPAHGSADGRECLDTTIDYLERLLGDSDMPLPPSDDEWDDFYQDTHTKNLKIVRGK